MISSNHFIILGFVSISILSLSGCNKSSASGDEALDRCEAAARKLAKTYGGDEEQQAKTYREELTHCTVRPGESLTAAGDAYLTCIDDAVHGAAMLRCMYELQEANKVAALAALEQTMLPLMKDVCGGKIVGDVEEDPRFVEISRLEKEARSLLGDDEEQRIDDLVEKIKKDAGCAADAPAAE